MERIAWVAPETKVQVFAANEYVAACWDIYCIKIGGGPPWHDWELIVDDHKSDHSPSGREFDQLIPQRHRGRDHYKLIYPDDNHS